jgi:D-amino-acid oxidase
VNPTRPSIAVVGSGVIGLSVVHELLRRERSQLAGPSVDLYAPQALEETTSATAAAYWAPYWVGDYRPQWAEATLKRLQELAEEGTPGVHFADFEEWLTEAGRQELEEEMALPGVAAAYWWRDFDGIDFRLEALQPPKTLDVPPQGRVTFTSRVRFRTVVARMVDYLRGLREQALASDRVRLVQEWVEDLDALAGRYDLVFHCTGWGAKGLAADDPETARMRLLAGMVCRVDCDSLSTAISLHRAPFHGSPLYIVPRQGSQSDVICGGTAIELDHTPEVGRPIEAPQPERWDEILDRCRSVEPRLQTAERHDRLCGLRPVRSSVRVEVDPRHCNLIHCYGHGGAGLTLSWGSARAAVDLMFEAE